MKTRKNLMVVFLIALLLVVFAVAVSAEGAEIVASGEMSIFNYRVQSNAVLVWSIDSNGTMDLHEVIGTTDNETDWFDYCESVKTVVIHDDVDYLKNVFYSQFAFEDGFKRNLINLERFVVDDNNNYYSSDVNGCLLSKDRTTLISYPAGNTSTFFTVPEQITTVLRESFVECKNLECLVLPSTIISVEKDIVAECSSLRALTICNAVGAFCKESGENILYNCDNLKTLTLGEDFNCFVNGSVDEYVMSNVIDRSIAIERIFVDTNNPFYSSVNGVLFDKEMQTLLWYPCGKQQNCYEIPKGVKCIFKRAFAYCIFLDSIVLPEGLEEIGEEAFGFTVIDGIVLPGSIKRVSSYAFYLCSAIKTIWIKGLTTQFEELSIGGYSSWDMSGLTKEEIRTIYYEAVFQGNYSVLNPYEADEAIVTGSLRCHAGSTAEAYAQETGMDYTLVHFYDDYVSTTEPTCTKQGFSTYKCVHCDATEDRDYVDPLDHDWHATPFVPATCTTGSFAPYICFRCGEIKKTDPTSPLGHKYQPEYEWAKDDSTVTASMTCIRCGNVSFKETAKVTTEVTVKPTCSTEGELTLIAAFNNKAFYAQTKTKVLPPDPDAHVLKVTVTPPTCLDDGYTTHACTLCRYGYSDEIVAALGHDYVNAKATGNGDGTHTLTCNRCKQPGEAIACADEGNDGHCDACGGQMRGGDHCRFCGKIHNGNFFDKLTGFFHRIIGIFKR